MLYISVLQQGYDNGDYDSTQVLCAVGPFESFDSRSIWLSRAMKKIREAGLTELALMPFTDSEDVPHPLYDPGYRHIPVVLKFAASRIQPVPLSMPHQ